MGKTKLSNMEVFLVPHYSKNFIEAMLFPALIRASLLYFKDKNKFSYKSQTLQLLKPNSGPVIQPEKFPKIRFWSLSLTDVLKIIWTHHYNHPDLCYTKL